jgi:hypothetical protein
MGAENLANMEFEQRTVKPVASRYTNYAIPGKVNVLFCDKKKLIVGLHVYSAELLTKVNKHTINTRLLFRTASVNIQ